MIPTPTWQRILQGTLALFVLNAFMSMTNLWPTPFVQLDKRIAPEFVLLWVIILFIVWLQGQLTRRAAIGLTLGYMLLVTGRYFDTTAPALFGRGYQSVLGRPANSPCVLGHPQKLPSLGLWADSDGLAAFIWLVYRILRACIRGCARGSALCFKKQMGIGRYAGGDILVTANVYGVRETWPYVSKPAIPTYLRQAKLLSTAFAERDVQRTLPPRPLDSDLGALRGLDVNLFF